MPGNGTTARGGGYGFAQGTEHSPGLAGLRMLLASRRRLVGSVVARLMNPYAEEIMMSLRSVRVLLLLAAVTAGGVLPCFGQERATLKGHTKALAAVAYSGDGKYLATGSYDKTAKVWDAATGKELDTIVGHNRVVEAVAFSPDGKILATGSYDRTVKLWDWAAGKQLASFEGHTNMIRSMAYSPDARTVASGSHDMTIKLWDVATGKERAHLTAHKGAVRSLAFTHDSKILASGSHD